MKILEMPPHPHGEVFKIFVAVAYSTLLLETHCLLNSVGSPHPCSPIHGWNNTIPGVLDWIVSPLNSYVERSPF